MSDSKPVKVCKMQASELVKNMCENGCNYGETMKNVPYRSAAGCLMYLMVATRPDVAVGVLSQFASIRVHRLAALAVFRYPDGTQTHGITFKTKATAPIFVGTRTWIGWRISFRRSTSGYVFTLSGGYRQLATARRQRSVALSSTEAEYMALSEAKL